MAMYALFSGNMLNQTNVMTSDFFFTGAVKTK